MHADDPTDEPARAPDVSAADEAAPARTAPRLLELLVCPVTKAVLELSGDKSELISRRARLAFPIRDGIPLLTRESARELRDDELTNKNPRA